MAKRYFQSLLNNQFDMMLKWFDILLIQKMKQHLA